MASPSSSTRLAIETSLRAWLSSEDAGCFVSDDVRLSMFTSEGAGGLSMGRGVTAERDIAKGTVLVEIPRTCAWNYQAAMAKDSALRPALESGSVGSMREDDLLVLHIMNERFVQGKASSHWWPSVDVLPREYDLTMFWSDEEVESLAGSNLHQLTGVLRKQTKGDWEALKADIFNKHPDIFPEAAFTLENYMWALATVWTRAMDFAIPGESRLRAMLPFADMFNHDPAFVAPNTVCHAFDVPRQTFIVRAGRDYKAGEQVCINYGACGDTRMLRVYGFVLGPRDNEAANSVDLYAPFSNMLPAFGDKEDIAKACGVKTQEPYPLTTATPVPEGLLTSLRIQHLDEDEAKEAATGKGSIFDKLNGKKPVNSVMESSVVQALLGGVSGMLQAYPTTLAEDEAELDGLKIQEVEEAASGAGSEGLVTASSTDSRKRMALLMRIGEKEILQKACDELAQKAADTQD